nr:cadherin-7-like [Nothobranchius furzeri]
MKYLCVLGMLSVFVFFLWEEPNCGATLINSVILRQGSSEESGRKGGVEVHLRRKGRSWVWNQFFVLEEFTGDEPLYVGKLHSDMDKGDGQVKYYLSGEGATSIFSINEQTGDIHAIRRLDREQQTFYTLKAQARDWNTNLPVEPESQFIIKVQDINDNAPRFLNGPYTAHVAERSPVGTSVVTVEATDADDPTYGNSARMVYSLLQGQPYFSIEPRTGVVRTALPGLDREVKDRYLLVVQAKDMMGQAGALSGTTTVSVKLTDVNDNPPRFLRKSYQFTVPESVMASSVVARIRALDQDLGPNAEVDFRILDSDELGTFRIFTDLSSQEGLVTLQKTLDYETKSSYTLNIEASNRHVDSEFLLVGSFNDVTTVHLLVEDVDEPPVFSSSVCRMEISEGAPVGSDVGSVSAQDPDMSNSPIRYSIESRSDLERFFSIDSLSGLIRTNRPLDREECVVHNITVIATETMDLSQVGTVVVLISVTDVNDNAPRFALDYQTSVCENARPGKVVETLSAVDPDEPEPGGHHFLFQLTADAAANHFMLRDNNDNTASVVMQQAGFLQRDKSVYFLPVVISDGGRPSLSSTNTLTITICSCNLQGRRLRCRHGATLDSDGLSTASTVGLTCMLSFLGIVMVTTVTRWRRKRGETRTMDEEQDVRENIVRCDDEGGGEEDTGAFDMLTLRHLNQMNFITPTDSRLRNKLLQEFIRDRLLEADHDLTAPPPDSVHTYTIEGGDSAADSLSSLDSLTSLESEQSYTFLREWGSRFKKLAELYEHRPGAGVA